MFCPLCNQKFVGKIGNNQFYCRECFIEFRISKNKVKLYEVCDDGSLLPYKDQYESKISSSANT